MSADKSNDKSKKKVGNSSMKSVLDYAQKVLTVLPRTRNTKVRRQQNINFYLHKYQEHLDAYNYLQNNERFTQGDLVARALLLYRDYENTLDQIQKQGTQEGLRAWDIENLLFAALDDDQSDD